MGWYLDKKRWNAFPIKINIIMAKQTNTSEKLVKVKIRRKGVHSKSKTSKLKGSKLYKKTYNSQGK